MNITTHMRGHQADGDSLEPVSLLGPRLTELRRKLGLTLKAVSLRTGIPISTLSKVQNGQATLNYEALVKLSVGLGVDVGTFFRPQPQDLRITRRAVDRRGQGRRGASERYAFEIFATELSQKHLVPGLLTVVATSLDAVGGYSRHKGEEFIYVVSGHLDLRTEFYAPVHLEAGDTAYLDSTMGHAFLHDPQAHEPETKLLVVCTHAEYADRGTLPQPPGDPS